MEDLLLHYEYEDICQYVERAKEVDYILACAMMESEERQARRWQVRPIYQLRRQYGAYENLVQSMRDTDIEQYYNFMHMEPATFDHLLSMVGNCLQKNPAFRDDVISPEERLALTIR